MIGSDGGVGHNVAVDDLVIGDNRRLAVGVRVVVSVRVEVTDMRRCSRHEMIAAEREGKRRHHRQGGRDTSAHR